MIVYHGSYIEVTKIDLTKCAPHKDFGRGFYVTKIKEQAETWAKLIGKNRNCKGVVYEYNRIRQADER
jgi:hypothetical protein